MSIKTILSLIGFIIVIYFVAIIFGFSIPEVDKNVIYAVAGIEIFLASILLLRSSSPKQQMAFVPMHK